MDKTKAVFFDAILQVDVENIKTEEMNELPLSNFEDELIGILDAYCYLENERAAHRIIVNPMNVFGSIMYQGFANERMDKKLIEGFRYSSYEILSFYYYESKGYRRIIEKVFRYEIPDAHTVDDRILIKDISYINNIELEINNNKSLDIS